MSPSRSSTASWIPVEAPEGTAARKRPRKTRQRAVPLRERLNAPFSVKRSTSTVGLPRESKICEILVSVCAPCMRRGDWAVPGGRGPWKWTYRWGEGERRWASVAFADVLLLRQDSHGDPKPGVGAYLQLIHAESKSENSQARRLGRHGPRTASCSDDLLRALDRFSDGLV